MHRDSLDDFTLLSGSLPGDESWGNYPSDGKKSHQAYELLTLNELFMADIEALRRKYDVGKYPIEGDKYDSEDLYPAKEHLDEFYDDINAISRRVAFPGVWDKAVELFVIGYEPELALVPSNIRRAIVAKNNTGYVEVRIYGTTDAKTIRKYAPRIAEMSGQIATTQDRESSVKYRPELQKSLRIKSLKDAGYTHKSIAELLADKQSGIEAEDIPPYVRNIKKQIEDIYRKIE